MHDNGDVHGDDDTMQGEGYGDGDGVPRGVNASSSLT
jgi:hypothetical protein